MRRWGSAFCFTHALHSGNWLSSALRASLSLICLVYETSVPKK
jgi:hypothetical protein